MFLGPSWMKSPVTKFIPQVSCKNPHIQTYIEKPVHETIDWSWEDYCVFLETGSENEIFLERYKRELEVQSVVQLHESYQSYNQDHHILDNSHELNVYWLDNENALNPDECMIGHDDTYTSDEDTDSIQDATMSDYDSDV